MNHGGLKAVKIKTFILGHEIVSYSRRSPNVSGTIPTASIFSAGVASNSVPERIIRNIGEYLQSYTVS
jgi:hypothetical protein